MNPYLKRVAERGQNGHGALSERRVAKTLGAKLTPASGATKAAKGDMKIRGETKVLVEAKSTVNSSLPVQYHWLVKIATEAMNVGSTPALAVSFVDPQGKARPHGDWVAVPRWAFHEMMEKINGR